MKRLLLGLLLSGFTYSAFSIAGEEYKANNLVLEYQKPTGTLSADFLKIKNEDINFGGEDIVADIEAKNDKLVIKLDNFEFELGGSIFDTIKDYESAIVAVEKIDSNVTNTEVSASEIDLRSSSRTLIRTVDMECASSSASDIIAQCIDSGVLTVDYILSAGSNIWKKVLGIQVAGETEVENTFLEINDGNYTMTLKVSGVKIKVKGTISYDGEVIDLWIKSANAGIINVKGRLLKELKKLENDNIKLVNDHLIITL